MVIKDINFLPENLIENNKRAQKNLGKFVIFTAIVLILAGLLVIPQIIYMYYDAQANSLDLQLKSLSEVQKKVNTLNDLKSQASRKTNAIEEITSSQTKVTEIANKIISGIPATVSLKNYSISGTDIGLSFMVDTPLETIDLIKSLEGLDMFEKVTIPSVSIIDKSDTITMSLKLKHK